MIGGAGCGLLDQTSTLAEVLRGFLELVQPRCCVVLEKAQDCVAQGILLCCWSSTEDLFGPPLNLPDPVCDVHGQEF